MQRSGRELPAFRLPLNAMSSCEHNFLRDKRPSAKLGVVQVDTGLPRELPRVGDVAVDDVALWRGDHQAGGLCNAERNTP